MALPLHYNWRSLLRRKSRLFLTTMGIALSVLIALIMLALARGITSGIQSTGHPWNVLVTARGAETIEFSALDRSVQAVLRASPYVATMSGEESRPLVSPEVFFAANFSNQGRMFQALLRGVLPVGLEVHDQVELVEGTFPTRAGEIMVGPMVAAKLGLSPSQLSPGETLVLEDTPWKIVGTFRAPGTVYEGEIWGPLDAIMTAFRRDELNAIVLRAADEEALEELLFDLQIRTDILVGARTETDYYAAHAASFAPLSDIVRVLAVLLTIGGAMIAMNTIFTSVTNRTREIGTLRVLGYRRWQIALGFLFEGILPALAAGALAGLLALTLNGIPFRIPMGVFRLQTDAELLLIGLALGLLSGLLGSCLAVARAIRLQPAQSIRHL